MMVGRSFFPLIVVAVSLLLLSVALWPADSVLMTARAPAWISMPLDQRRIASFPRLVDGAAQVTIPVEPVRIVAASVFSAEVLTTIVPRSRIVAVIALAADPRYSAVAEQVKNFVTCGAEPEELLAQRPDLVVTDPFTRAETRFLLAQIQVPVLEIRPVHDLEDVEDNIRLLGWATGCDTAADALVEDVRNRRSALQAKAALVNGWRVLNLAGATSTYGKGSLLDAAVTAAGAVNLAGSRGMPSYQELDIEQILSWRPDALLISVPADGEAKARERLRQMHGMQLLSCVQHDRIVFVPGTAYGSTSHHVLTVAEMLQTQLCKWGRP